MTISLDDNAVINGALISVRKKSSVNISGNAAINHEPNVSTIWENLVGLEITPNLPPRFIDWAEE